MEKLRITRSDAGVVVVGNRRGLLGLAEVCTQLANLPENRADARQLGNHYHFAEYMNNTEPGSIELEVLYDPEL